MTMPNNPTPEGAAAATAQGAAATGSQQVDWQAQAQDWERRFKGLQGKYQHQEGKFTDLSGQLHDLTEKHTALSGEKDALGIQVRTLTDANAKFQADLQAATLKHDRMALIVNEFPGLLSFESKGLLPAGGGDELRTKLKDFAATIQAQGQAAAAALLNGQTPPAPPEKPETRTAKDALKEANAALKANKIDDYNRLYGEYVALSAKENK